MSMDETQIFEELKSCKTEDPFLCKVLGRSWEILCQSEEVNRLNEFALYVINFERASPSVCESYYFTRNCKALLTDNTIIVNEGFLLEIEAAIRSFELSESLLDTPYLKGDEELYGLIKRIRTNPGRYLDRMRRFGAKDESFDEDAVLDELINLVLYFIGHEVGHLLDQVDQRSFGTFLQQDAPLEHRISNAVVRLCRHVDEFERFGFDLPGFPFNVVQLDSEIRKIEKKLRKELRKENEHLYANHTKWFENENSADKTGTKIVLDYLNRVEQEDEIAAERQQYLLFKAFFVVAVYSWYKEILVFCERLGVGGLASSESLTVAMMKDREQYIRAASLFGDVHRFTLLRGFLATKKILEERSSYFEMDKQERTIWRETGMRKEAKKSSSAQKEWWLSECLQRHMLLGLLMDTAVKIAFACCATGWLKEADKRRVAPQLLIIPFGSIQQEVITLRRFR